MIIFTSCKCRGVGDGGGGGGGASSLETRIQNANVFRREANIFSLAFEHLRCSPICACYAKTVSSWFESEPRRSQRVQLVVGSLTRETLAFVASFRVPVVEGIAFHPVDGRGIYSRTLFSVNNRAVRLGIRLERGNDFAKSFYFPTA